MADDDTRDRVRALVRDVLSKAMPAESEAPSSNISSRSEEHTSELQSRSDLVCRLLLEKKKNKIQIFLALRTTLQTNIPQMDSLTLRRASDPQPTTILQTDLASLRGSTGTATRAHLHLQ